MTILRISKAQKKRLQQLGATVSVSSVTASETQLRIARIGGARRRLLIARGQLTVSGA